MAKREIATSTDIARALGVDVATASRMLAAAKVERHRDPVTDGMYYDLNEAIGQLGKPPCVLHPGRPGPYEVTGIRICPECFERYRTERRNQQGLKDRPFYQSILKAGYGLQKSERKERA